MSNLYPSLEDLKVDSYAKEQVAQQLTSGAAAAPGGSMVPYGGLYAGLGLEELMEYAGLDISPAAMSALVPADVLRQMGPIARITAPNDKALAVSSIKQGLRELILAKDGNNKLGLSVKSIDKGIFVCFVWKGSAAAMTGLRFGDQILQINGENVAGWSTDKAMSVLQKCDGARVSLIVRDRPYERTVTVVKDSMNHVGFVFKDGEITALVKDSSACRNGLLINHQIVEINAQNVVGLKDADIIKICADAPVSITLTIMPVFIFKHLIKSVGSLKKYMDRSVPEL